MIKLKIFIFGSILAILFVVACVQEKKSETPVPETVREKAEAVGKLGDQTVTQGLEKGLTGVVDKSADRAKELNEAAK